MMDCEMFIRLTKAKVTPPRKNPAAIASVAQNGARMKRFIAVSFL